MLERGSHRGRVGVVRVVDQQAAAGQRRFLAPPARELDLDAALRQREPERLHREQRCGRVLSLVPRRERELELEALSVEREDGPTAALGLLERLDALRPEAANLDVVTGQVRREQRLVGHHGGPARRERGHDLGLRLGHVLDRPQQLQMHWPDARDHAHVRFGDRAQLRDLTEPAHAHLADHDFRVRARSASASAGARSRCCAHPLPRPCALAGGTSRPGCPWSRSSRWSL